MNTPYECTEDNVDNAIDKINGIILNAASQSLKKCKFKIFNKTKKLKKWYNQSLRNLKMEVKKCGKILCMNPYNLTIRNKYHTILKTYKKQCKFERRMYKSKIINMMENLHSHNPKGYWKLVDELTDKHKSNSTIEIEKLFHHYKTLNNDENYNDVSQKADIQAQLEDAEKIKIFSELDFAITDSEVSKAISNLNCLKCCS